MSKTITIKSACSEFVATYNTKTLTATFVNPYTERDTKRFMTLAALRADVARQRETFRQMARDARGWN